MRARLGPVERDEDAVLDLLGDLVLEAGGEPVGLVPGVAEHVGEEPLDDAVPADRRQRAPAPVGGELDALVRLVVDEAAVGQALDGGGDGAGRQAEPLGQHAGVGVAVARKAVNGLQRLAISFGEGFHLGFDGGQSKFCLPKSQV